MEVLYLTDSYLKEFTATIISVKDDKYIVLDKTAFYPNSGGQPYDTGKIIKNNQEYNVVFVGKFDDVISHEVEKPGLKVNDNVKCLIDWDRRYQLMKMHTTTHVLSSVLHNKSGALITGNQLGLDQTRIDFSLDKFDREEIQKYVDEANSLLRKNLEIKHYFIKREEAMKNPDLFRLAAGFKHDFETIRIVEIGDVDKQADGGTHVKNTRECGQIELVKLENKGKNNRRLYFKLNPV